MEKKSFNLPSFIISHAAKIEKLFFVLCIISLIMMPMVKVNYDLTEYLPDNVPSKEGLNLMEEEFGYPGTARVMVDDVSLYEAKRIKDAIADIDGVDMVLWCDSSTDIFQSSDFIDYDEIKDYYRDGSAVMDITFVGGDTDESTADAIDEISELIGEKGHMVGMAVQNKSLEENVARELNMIMVIAVIMIYIILTISTTAWAEPVLFLIVMGVAIVLNKGTNLLLGEVSFLTDNVVAVLQLAVSMDYSIFLLHAYTSYKAKGMEMREALTAAVDEAFKSIIASSMTTIVGFIVLTFMRFSIGFDLGLSLTKGIIFSLATVLFLMPALIIRMSSWLEKSEHASFMPSFDKLSRGIYKLRVPILIAAAITAIPLYTAQGMNSFLFGNASVGAGEGTKVYEDDLKISEKFGRSNMMLAIIPNTSNVTEKELSKELKDLPYMKSVTSLTDELPEGIPEDFLPESVTGLMHTEDYARLLMYTRTKEESPTAFDAADEIESVIRKYYPEDSYLVGGTPSTMDIKNTIVEDYDLVNVLSLIGVFVVVMLSFESLATPVVVMIPIELAIWTNMAVPYLMGEEVNYIGYIIVSCIQLGATVDYSILTTSNYSDARKKLGLNKREAAIYTLKKSIPAILTSGSILTICGYILYFVSSISAIGSLGHLIGRGAWMSVLLVLGMLPPLLVFIDPLLEKNEYKRVRELIASLRERRKRRRSERERRKKGNECKDA